MFEFCSFGSGSSGNSSLIKTKHNKILVDAGLSLKKIESSFADLGLSPERVDFVLLTHAHSDHAKSALNFAIKYQKPVFLTKETYQVLNKKEPQKLAKIKANFLGKQLQLENLLINIYRLPHIGCRLDGKDDAGGNIGFVFDYQVEGKSKSRFSYFTDLGVMPQPILKDIKDCDYYFLEANHDVGWQKASKRPYQVIERNLSDFGHLSNEQSGKILTKVITKDNAKRRTKGVMLAHVSRDCNSHLLAEDTINNILEEHKISGVDIKIAPEKGLSEHIKIL